LQSSLLQSSRPHRDTLLALPPHRLATVAGLGALLLPLLGWASLAIAVVLGDDFSNAGLVPATFFFGSVALGLVGLASWCTGLAALVAGRNEPEAGGQRGRAMALAALAPLSWLVGWLIAALWFGYQALSGPWMYLGG
jgi:hypothetical protein